MMQSVNMWRRPSLAAALLITIALPAFAVPDPLVDGFQNPPASAKPQKILDDAGPLAGKTLNNALIDSWEVGGQNWTPEFCAEFQRRRGYDLQRFLPALTGRVIESAEATDRFLWDFRRAIADLVLGEFWAEGQVAKPRDLKLVASIMHTFGKPLVGAESFTSAERWELDPQSLKAIGDEAFCHGLNRQILHSFIHQPWTNRAPGMTLGKFGTHFAALTWQEMAGAWTTYLTRCQFLLQRGRFVADAACFTGEEAPALLGFDDPGLPPDHDYDGVNADALRTATVREGRIVLDSGMNYAVLVLPPGNSNMRLATLLKSGLLGPVRILVGEQRLLPPP